MSTTPACYQPQCNVGSGGICLEGFSPASTCPYRRADVAGALPASAASVFVDLPSAKALTPTEASDVTREMETNVVFVAGDHDSGKTTLLTSIYESFQDAPFAGYQFAGSCTLHGWEERCHPGRVESGRTQPHTEHTHIGEGLKFLHLWLSTVGRPHPFGILFSDISGEAFRRLRDSTGAVQSLPALRRADVFCVVCDGERIAGEHERFVLRNNVRALLRSLKEAAALRADCRIQVVFSKWDVISGLDSAELFEFIQDSKELFLGEFAELEFYNVAARPRTAKLPFAHGVATLLRSWCPDRTRDAKATPYSAPIADRHFTRFGQRAEA